jgi:hypothetical protein
MPQERASVSAGLFIGHFRKGPLQKVALLRDIVRKERRVRPPPHPLHGQPVEPRISVQSFLRDNVPCVP